MRTGESAVSFLVFLNSLIDSGVSGLAIQPRGLREKICTASQPVSLAMVKASCRPCLMGAWKPIFGRVNFFIDSFALLTCGLPLCSTVRLCLTGAFTQKILKF